MTNSSLAKLFFLTTCVFGAHLGARADTVIYQDTTNPTGTGTVFQGATNPAVGTNIDLNQLTMAPGSAGLSITSLSFLAFNDNSTSVQARPVMYVWADNGAGQPGTLLGTFDLADTTLGAFAQTSVTYNVGGGLIVPSNGVIWAGLAFDNDGGASSITNAQLNALGGLNYSPATIGTAPTVGYFLGPGGATSNPSTTPNDILTPIFGWTVTASPVTAATPEPSSILMLGTGLLGLAGVLRSKTR